VNRELIIDSNQSEVNIALLEDKNLVELHKEQVDNKFVVGDVFLAKVKKIMLGLNAAFVDVGYEKDGFLHYLDLGPQIRTFNSYVKLALLDKANLTSHEEFKREKDIEKTGKINQVLTSGQQILVQIAKEPISTKGPRITTEISFPGRYIVLLPFSKKVSISQKIKSKQERSRLSRLMSSIVPNNYGVIIRTVAENKKVAEIDADLRDLIEKWESIIKKLANATPPVKVLSELDRTSQLLRDLLNESFNTIHVNDQVLFEETKTYIETIAPDKKDIVKYYRGKTPIFDNFNIGKQLRSSFGKNVTIKSGVYLVIEHTEALHVIDINSGHRVKKENSQEENALIVNNEAAVEVARQLRLRDMGGIIVVDFIDMREAKNRRALFQKMHDEMAKDRAKHTILPPTKFGLVQITRQRVRPEMILPTLEKCPTCKGTGEIKSSMILIDEIENNINYLLHDQNESNISLSVHPFIYAYLTRRIMSIQMNWFIKYKKWVTITEVHDYQIMEFNFFNKNGDLIKK